MEFGNPIESEKDYKLIHSISPYENLAKQTFPACFIRTALDDPRVPFWGNLKFIEKLRDVAMVDERFPDFGDKNIVVRIDREGGHFGTTSNNTNLAMATMEMAWLDFIMFKKNNH